MGVEGATMPAADNIYGAFVTELEKRLGLDPSAHFLAFPEFSLRIGLDDLLFEASALEARHGLTPALAEREARLNQESLAVLANQAPRAASAFLTDGAMLWTIYQRVLTQAELATAGEEAALLRLAQLFQERRTAFDLAERDSLKGDGAAFYATGLLPPSDVTDASGWTRIVLDRAQITRRSREIRPAVRAWLEQRGLLAGSGEVAPVAMTGEVFVLTLQRAWFEPGLFRNRLWRWREGALSTGGSTPTGLLPAYVTRLILVRKLQIELDLAPPVGPPTATTPGLLARAAPGGGPALLAALTPVGAAGKPLPLEQARARAKPPALNLRQFAELTMQREPDGKRTLNLSPLGSLATAFPAPITFLGRPVLERIAAEQKAVGDSLAGVTAQHAAAQRQVSLLTPQISQLARQVQRYPDSVHTVTVRDHRSGHVSESILDVDALRQRLAGLQAGLRDHQAELARVEQAMTELTRQANDLEALRQYYEMLAQPGDEDDVFVLAFDCELTPKSPDPDPAFFPGEGTP